VPELPEVEVVRSGLEPAVTGARVAGVEVLEPRSLRRHAHGADDFAARLEGAVLERPERRGKFLWVPLAASGTALLVHLGMSGQVLVREPGVDDRQTRVRIDLEHPEHGPLRLNFADQRIFGWMALDPLAPTGLPDERVPALVAHIARDPLDPHFDDHDFITRIRARSTTVKRALLDQTMVSGIGNIYADEALWAARIHFDQPTRTLSAVKARQLIAEVRRVLTRALAEGGTSFDAQYVNVNGASGYFSHSLNAYGQQGRPCARCGRPIVRVKFMNRGAHYCASCQRIRGGSAA